MYSCSYIGNFNDVDLDLLLVGLTNKLLYEHNNDGVVKFPGRRVNFPCSTTIQPIHRSVQVHKQG